MVKTSPCTAWPERPPADDASLEAYVRNRCLCQIEWYTAHSQIEMYLDKIFVIAVVALSGLTPILILWGAVPRPVQAIPSALAGIAVGIAGSFNWRDNWVRWKATQEQLKSELSLFDARAGAYAPGGDALNVFAMKVEALSSQELGKWQAGHLKLDEARAKEKAKPH